MGVFLEVPGGIFGSFGCKLGFSWYFCGNLGYFIGILLLSLRELLRDTKVLCVFPGVLLGV